MRCNKKLLQFLTHYHTGYSCNFSQKIGSNQGLAQKLFGKLSSLIGALKALTRFMARRGPCRIIHCDNGFNFADASNLFSSLDWNLFVSDIALYPVKRIFKSSTSYILEEWLVKLIGILKRLLQRVLHKSSLTYSLKMKD